jgi:erythromycin esterase-like protein
LGGAIGFYGLDLYSLHASIAAVIKFLEDVDPEAARRARERYSCFDRFGTDAQVHGFVASRSPADSCEEDVVRQLVELQRKASDYAARDGRAARDELFFARENARRIANAERYYREMYRSSVTSWNLRDEHMAETVDALRSHLAQEGVPAKIVVWEHNSHIGDARATSMGRAGELNVGQLARERYGRQALLVGFTTYTGTVTAASEWDGPAERKRVRPALAGSYEELLHQFGEEGYLLVMRGADDDLPALQPPRLERAIGVLYLPETERASHYFQAVLPRQFDAVIHIDETTAVTPLERTPRWEAEEPPETYPFGV